MYMINDNLFICVAAPTGFGKSLVLSDLIAEFSQHYKVMLFDIGHTISKRLPQHKRFNEKNLFVPQTTFNWKQEIIQSPVECEVIALDIVDRRQIQEMCIFIEKQCPYVKHVIFTHQFPNNGTAPKTAPDNTYMINMQYSDRTKCIEVNFNNNAIFNISNIYFDREPMQNYINCNMRSLRIKNIIEAL
jgi:hypothetical protein